MNLGIIFLTGLTVGGLTCLAVQGGLLASVISARENETHENSKKHALYVTAVFLLAKLIAYTVLGFILGSFGGAINLNSNVQIYMQLFAGIYMIAVALNLLEVHPIFRYAIIQPPRFLTKLVRNQSKSKDIFAPALLGGLTIFIPCGTTVAMEVLAVSSANPLVGAGIMASFILGTIPLFFGLGAITSFLGEKFRSKFYKVAAVLVFSLGLISIYGSFVALGFSPSFKEEKLYSEAPTNQSPEIIVTSTGYSPTYIRVAKNKSVTIKLTSKDAFSCASAFRIPSLGIARNLQANEEQFVTFTPTQVGQIPFTCSMGMYRGVIEVI